MLLRGCYLYVSCPVFCSEWRLRYLTHHWWVKMYWIKSLMRNCLTFQNKKHQCAEKKKNKQKTLTKHNHLEGDTTHLVTVQFPKAYVVICLVEQVQCKFCSGSGEHYLSYQCRDLYLLLSTGLLFFFLYTNHQITLHMKIPVTLICIYLLQTEAVFVPKECLSILANLRLVPKLILFFSFSPNS